MSFLSLHTSVELVSDDTGSLPFSQMLLLPMDGHKIIPCKEGQGKLQYSETTHFISL